MIVVWRVTEHCNLACPFCGYDRRFERARNTADPGQIRRFGEILSAYQKKTGDRVLVSWMGGEPLLWSPLKDLSATFSSQLDLGVSTTTNGTPLGCDAMRQHILAHYSELTISVDGLGATQEELRGWPGGFDALKSNVAALAAARRKQNTGPKLRANVVLMRKSFDQFSALCMELSQWGIEEITFNQLGGNDRPEFYAPNRLLHRQALQLAAELPALRQWLADSGVRLVGSQEYLRRIVASARDERIPVEDCRPGDRFLFINERGIVAPCSFTAGGYGVPLEEIHSIETFVHLPARFAGARRRQRMAPCEDCHSTQVFEKFEVS